jgi:putative DNA primase/helicase
MRRSSSRPPAWCFPNAQADESEDSDQGVRSKTVDVAGSEKGETEKSFGVEHGKRLALRPLSQIVAAPIEWVWDGVIPRGALTLLTGEPGVGKSRFVAELVAGVTRGMSGPRDPRLSGRFLNETNGTDGVENCVSAEGTSATAGGGEEVALGGTSTAAVPASAVVFSTEMDLTDSVQPRLLQAGADLSRVFSLSLADDDGLAANSADAAPATDGAGSDHGVHPTSFRFDRHLPLLEAELGRFKDEGIDVRIVVIDAIEMFFEWSIKRAAIEVRVEKLVELAKRFRVAIVAVSNVDPAEMVRPGRRRSSAVALALREQARAVWMIGRNLDYSDRRLLLPIKTNYTMIRTGLSYGVGGPAIEWDPEPILIKGDDYLVEAAEHARNPLAREYRAETLRATEWLHQRLSEGPVQAQMVQEDAGLNDICPSTLKKAYGYLRCKTSREKRGRVTKQIWRLPGDEFFFRADAPRGEVKPGQGVKIRPLSDCPETQKVFGVV